MVIDNCEHLLGSAAGLVHALLRACPGLVVLATSRQPLGVPGEQAWRVPSLSVPEATQLFGERARLVRPNLRLDERGAAAVAAICRRLDGIPLAIELAASRTRAMSVAAILDGLDDRFRLLPGGQLLDSPLALRQHVDQLGPSPARQRLRDRREAVVERVLGSPVTHAPQSAYSRSQAIT